MYTVSGELNRMRKKPLKTQSFDDFLGNYSRHV